MNPLTPASLLAAWERARIASAAERPLLLLAAADPDRPPEEWACLSVPERDALLVDLRAALFGAELRSLAPCPRCGIAVELSFRTEQVRPEPPRAGRDAPIAFAGEGFTGTFRRPVSADWIALASRPSIGDRPEEELRRALAARCLLTVNEANNAHSEQPPAELLAVVADAIARHDADAHTELAVSCPGCGHAWSALFDIASFLWRELDAHCVRLLRQVHQLARAYGWTETEIFRLSPARREAYLEMTAHG